jgi:cell surface protein SprA
MLLRKGRFSYTENYGTVLPGFTPDPRLMGLSNGFEAPGWSFAAGLQPDDKWLEAAGQKGWISHRNELNQQVTRSYSQNIDAGVTLEPFTDFRVELNLLKQYTRNNTLLFKDFNTIIHPDSTDIEQRARRDMGSYTISYFALNTLFDKDVDGMFERFKNNRSVISKRLGREVSGNTNPHTKYGSEYAQGYGRTQQEVLLPAFLSAYTDKDPNKFGLDVFKTLPSLNWKLNYNGLSKVGKLKKIFSSITLQHGYVSKLTMASYNTDIFFQPQNPFVADELNADYIARFEIPQVVISENLQPLIGINVKMKNGFQASFDFKKSRQLAMSFVDYQLAETRSTGYTGEIGYTAKNVNIPFLTGKKAVKRKGKKGKSKKKDTKKPGTTPAPPAAGGGKSPNDMIFKFNMDFRDDLTANHRLDQANEAQPTRGQRQIRISPSIDYNLNRRLSLRVFADYSKTVPKTSQSFPITTLNTGVTVQFTLN